MTDVGQELSAPLRSGSLVIRAASIVDTETGDVLPDHAVLVVGDRITAIGPNEEIEVPEDAEVVDGSGQYIIPGLWDMHAHASRDGRAPRFWPTFIAHGVTGFREMGSYVDSLLYWRGEAARPERRAPRVSWGAMVDAPPLIYSYIVPVPDAGAAVEVVDLLADAGFDFVKVYERIGREAYFALAERARARGIPLAGHIPTSVTALEAVEAGQVSFEHFAELLVGCTPGTGELPPSPNPFNEPPTEAGRAAVSTLYERLATTEPAREACDGLLEQMVERGTWFTPTLTLVAGHFRPSTFAADARMDRVPTGRAADWAESGLPSEAEPTVGEAMWRHSLAAVRIAHEAGVRILAGTDASDQPRVFVGSGLHDELVYLVEAGLTPLEALQAATLSPARFMDRADEFGTVTVGKRADLVLLDANPLDHIANVRRVRAVILRGEHLDRSTLDEMASMEWVGVQ